jgi:NAD(P)-dependent dehydrogenase (short-subunit alcohol dehydrogenase family)
MKTKPARKLRPPQSQRRQPGIESAMKPRPQAERPLIVQRLAGRVALITGGDSGIGRAVAIAFAREGADVAFCYLNEHRDARETRERVEELGRKCFVMAGDVGKSAFCARFVKAARAKLGRLDIIVNNAAEQPPQEKITDITDQQLERTFRTNIFSYFYIVRAAVPYLKEGSVIINTTSVTAYRGSKGLLDYSATKGAIVSFTRSLSLALVDSGIRVNGVAPGPIWTPLIPATFKPKAVAKFGSEVPMARAGEPAEVAPCYVFLASQDSSYLSGQVLHPNGGEVING